MDSVLSDLHTSAPSMRGELFLAILALLIMFGELYDETLLHLYIFGDFFLNSELNFNSPRMRLGVKEPRFDDFNLRYKKCKNVT